MMPRRFFTLAVLALIAGPAGAQEAGPEQLVRSFYRSGFDDLKMPLSRSLRRLANAALARSKRLNEPVAGLDFGWTTGSQDGDGGISKTLAVRTVSQTAATAVVEARFRDPQPQVIRYRLVKEGDRWLVEDIDYPNQNESLSKLLAMGARGKS